MRITPLLLLVLLSGCGKHEKPLGHLNADGSTHIDFKRHEVESLQSPVIMVLDSQFSLGDYRKGIIVRCPTRYFDHNIKADVVKGCKLQSGATLDDVVNEVFLIERQVDKAVNRNGPPAR